MKKKYVKNAGLTNEGYKTFLLVIGYAFSSNALVRIFAVFEAALVMLAPEFTEPNIAAIHFNFRTAAIENITL